MPRATPGCLYALKGIREQMLNPQSELHQLWREHWGPSSMYNCVFGPDPFIFSDRDGPIAAFWGIAPAAEFLRLESQFPGVSRIYMHEPEADEHPLVITANAAWHAYYQGQGHQEARVHGKHSSSAAAAKARSLFGDL